MVAMSLPAQNLCGRVLEDEVIQRGISMMARQDGETNL